MKYELHVLQSRDRISTALCVSLRRRRTRIVCRAAARRPRSALRLMLAPSTLSPARAINFCATSPSAVVVTVWPSGAGELATVIDYIEQTCGASVLHTSAVALQSPLAQLLSVMALYDGEEWLESNCWYMEQPLPEGPPSGPYAGAKWKHALCFKGDLLPQVIVADVAAATSSVWAGKYALRASLARASGNPGNSCIHLTDQQDEAVLAAYRSGERLRAYGSDCDASYAYACARALLHPASVAWLNAEDAAALPLGSPPFREAWRRYTAWLHEPPEGGRTVGEGESFDAAPPFV